MKVIDQRKLRLNQEIMNVRFAQQEIEELVRNLVICKSILATLFFCSWIVVIVI